jgi:hypothetical protein
MIPKAILKTFAHMINAGIGTIGNYLFVVNHLFIANPYTLAGYLGFDAMIGAITWSIYKLDLTSSGIEISAQPSAQPEVKN